MILVQGETEKTLETGSPIYETTCGAETLFQIREGKGTFRNSIRAGVGQWWHRSVTPALGRVVSSRPACLLSKL